MDRRVRNILIGALFACVLSLALPFGGFKVLAASAKISFSDPTATVGQEFNVTVRVTATDGNLGASDLVLSYDKQQIEFVSGNNANGGAGSVRLVGTMDSNTTSEFSYTLKFKALQAGDTSISVASQEIYDSDTQAVNVTKVGSSTVKVKAPQTYSSEAALASLKVSPGQLTPAFSPDVLSYTVNVGGNVEKLAVSAEAKDSKAKTVVSGGSGLKTGTNTVVCKVTAEDGQTVKSYMLTVNKSESSETPESDAAEAAVTEAAVTGELKADIDGVEYSVASSFDPAALPEGYTQSACTYNGMEIMSGTGNGLTLIYLQKDDGTGSFYIYVPETGAMSPYITVETAARTILILPIDDTIEIPDGFVESNIELSEDLKARGWVWETDEEEQYCVIYGMNESGEKGLYRYDRTERTFQRYFKDPALKSQYDDAAVEDLLNKYNALCKDYDLRFIAIVVLIVISLILFFIVINLLIKRREHREKPEREEALTPVKRRAIQEETAGRRQSQASGTGRQIRQTENIGRPTGGDDRQMSERRRPAVYPEPEHRRTDLADERSRDRYQEAAMRRTAASSEQGYLVSEPTKQRQTSQSSPEQRYQEKRYSDQNHPAQEHPVQKYTQNRHEGQNRPASGRPQRPSSTGQSHVTQERRTSRPESRHEGQSRPTPGKLEKRYEDQSRPAQRYPESRYTNQGNRASEYSDQRYSEQRRQTASDRPVRSERKDSRYRDAGMEEVIRQRELERAERARKARERLERERLEDEKRTREARLEGQRQRKAKPASDDDGFEFFDLN